MPLKLTVKLSGTNTFSRITHREKIVKTANVIILITRDSGSRNNNIGCVSLPFATDPKREVEHSHENAKMRCVYMATAASKRELLTFQLCAHIQRVQAHTAQDDTVWSLNLIKYTFSPSNERHVWLKVRRCESHLSLYVVDAIHEILNEIHFCRFFWACSSASYIYSIWACEWDVCDASKSLWNFCWKAINLFRHPLTLVTPNSLQSRRKTIFNFRFAPCHRLSKLLVLGLL